MPKACLWLFPKASSSVGFLSMLLGDCLMVDGICCCTEIGDGFVVDKEGILWVKDLLNTGLWPARTSKDEKR